MSKPTYTYPKNDPPERTFLIKLWDAIVNAISMVIIFVIGWVISEAIYWVYNEEFIGFILPASLFWIALTITFAIVGAIMGWNEGSLWK